MIQSKETPSPSPLQTAQVPIDFDDEPSGPYIPISECYTGKPVSFKAYPNSNHHLPPPPLPPSQATASSNNLHHYSHPTHLSHYKLPNSPGVHHHPLPHQQHHHNHHQVTNYDVPRSSVFTKVALPVNSPAGISSSNTLNGRKCKPHNLTGAPFSHTIGRHERLSDNSPSISLRNRVSKPNGDFASHQNYRNEPPPRPPKPHKLNNRSKSESCSPAAASGTSGTGVYGSNHFTNITNSNDHLSPSTPLNNNHHHHLDSPTSPGQFNPTITSSLNNININNNSNNSNNNSNNHNHNHNNNNINNNQTTSQPLTLDDVYDFPKSEPVFTSLRTAIPAPGNRASKGNSHSYTNAPPGHLSKPPVFTYDYKGTLPVYLDDNNIAFDLDNCDRSPSTPNSAFDSLSSSGSLSKSLTPPAVNRDLKPKRRDSDSDTNVSPTSPTFTLAPPPAHSKSYSNKPMRHLNDVPPRVPSRGRQFPHHLTRDESNSDEDIISHSSSIFHKRNSSLDDQSRRAYTVPRKSPSECPSVTYLDLDLKGISKDKDSLRTRSFNPSDPYKSLNHSKDLGGISNLSGSQSTVYKSIDFVATDAFRQLRISSQRLVERD